MYSWDEVMINHLDYEEVFDSLADILPQGFCVNPKCGASSLGVEPDAEERRCEVCLEYTIYGAERVLIMMEGS